MLVHWKDVCVPAQVRLKEYRRVEATKPTQMQSSAW